MKLLNILDFVIKMTLNINDAIQFISTRYFNKKIFNRYLIKKYLNTKSSVLSFFLLFIFNKQERTELKIKKSRIINKVRSIFKLLNLDAKYVTIMKDKYNFTLSSEYIYINIHDNGQFFTKLNNKTKIMLIKNDLKEKDLLSDLIEMNSNQEFKTITFQLHLEL
jgi:hypothetical protein